MPAQHPRCHRVWSCRRRSESVTWNHAGAAGSVTHVWVWHNGPGLQSNSFFCVTKKNLCKWTEGDNTKKCEIPNRCIIKSQIFIISLSHSLPFPLNQKKPMSFALNKTRWCSAGQGLVPSWPFWAALQLPLRTHGLCECCMVICFTTRKKATLQHSGQWRGKDGLWLELENYCHNWYIAWIVFIPLRFGKNIRS